MEAEDVVVHGRVPAGPRGLHVSATEISLTYYKQLQTARGLVRVRQCIIVYYKQATSRAVVAIAMLQDVAERSLTEPLRGWKLII